MGVEGTQVLNAPMTVVGMVNGMIGGLILILPVYALTSGYIDTLIVILVTGVFSFYSCYLCVLHMGDQTDLDYAVLRHFNGARWAKIFYDVCVWLNLILIDLLYFELIVAQWIGLIPPHHFSVINAAVNAIILFALVFVLKYFQFGSSLMAYGIVSIIAYLIFLIWVVATYDQGNNSTPYTPFGPGFATLAAAMGQAFSIQSFFIPVLKKNPNPHKYTFYTMLAYIIGGLAYYYIAYMGSIGIWHRTYVPTDQNQQTIEQYFGGNSWEVNIIEAIYLIHLYSVFPEFMLISKKRIFGVFGLKESPSKGVNVQEVVYFLLMVAVCFVVGYFEVNINDIIDINGAVIGFFFIYLIPAVLHIRCLYFSTGKTRMPQLQSIQDIGGEEEKSEEVVVSKVQRAPSQIEIVEGNFSKNIGNKQSDDNQNGLKERLIQEEQAQVTRKVKEQAFKSQRSVPKKEKEQQQSEVDYSSFHCDCFIQDYSKGSLVGHWILMIVMLLMGLFILINGLYQVAT